MNLLFCGSHWSSLLKLALHDITPNVIQVENHDQGNFIKEGNLKWYYDENRIFPIVAILRHKKVACMRRKMLFTLFKYLFSFQRY